MASWDGNAKLPGLQHSRSSDSYSQNSGSQSHLFSQYCQPYFLRALDCVISTFLEQNDKTSYNACGEAKPCRKSPLQLRIADYGSSFGPTALEHATIGLRSVIAAKSSLKLCEKIEIQWMFCDLPGNDFNALFRSFRPEGPQLQHIVKVITEGVEGYGVKAFAAAVPGSFYSRVLQENSLHFATCTFSLHWLSQVPEDLLDKNSKSWNGGHIWIDSNRPEVLAAYVRQFQQDAKRFLQCRLEEMVEGGILFIAALSRKLSQTSPETDMEFKMFWEDVLQCCWKEMVDEGIIGEQEMDMFNYPFFNLHPSELQTVMDDLENALEVLTLELLEDCLVLPVDVHKNLMSNVEAFAEMNTKRMAALTKPLLRDYLGESRTEDFFRRFHRKTIDKIDRLRHGECSLPSVQIVIAILRKLKQ
ncbi:hypothetical protein KP509_05G098200 [Ceratopteris richardii]|uniref:Uncharacterized protein n=1 Tax=Ceratopteris richardii TaxID=49495 RepID=A0A8T2UWX7_CERRI|nr:hypothetical protein KP509_05G098200 [Ceratopteris richardii]